MPPLSMATVVVKGGKRNNFGLFFDSVNYKASTKYFGGSLQVATWAPPKVLFIHRHQLLRFIQYFLLLLNILIFIEFQNKLFILPFLSVPPPTVSHSFGSEQKYFL